MPTPIKLGSSAAQASRLCLAATTVALAVDPAAGTIANLQLMAAGREAKGHGFWIDEKTLETALEVVKSRGGRLKAYVTHDHSGPGTWYWSQDGSELDVCGFFSSVSIQKSQLVAGLCEFYSSFRTDPEDKRRYDRLMEMAQKTPDLIGLSVEVWGYAVFVGKDGVEYAQRPEGVELNYDGMPALRVTEMWAAAFVGDGAATDGLHAKLSDGRRPKKGKLAAALAALLSSLGMAEEPEPEAAAPAPERSPENAVHPAATSEQPASPSPDTSAMKILQDIRTRFSADKARLAKAMNILGEAADPATLTIEAVALQVVEADLSAVRVELATATNKVTDLEATNATLTADKAKLERQVETLKTGGHRGIDLGAGGAGGGASGITDVNPWAPGSINYTLQVQLLRDEPARAEALKAAAAGMKAAAKGAA